mgnify:CR=1 FL=1
MPKLKLIVFSTNLDSISGSTVGHSYQAVLDEFKYQAAVYIYGPGHPKFSKNDLSSTGSGLYSTTILSAIINLEKYLIN